MSFPMCALCLIVISVDESQEDEKRGQNDIKSSDLRLYKWIGRGKSRKYCKFRTRRNVVADFESCECEDVRDEKVLLKLNY